MARHLVAKFSDESAHHKYSYLVFTCSILLLESSALARPTSSENDFKIGQDDGSWNNIANTYIGAAWPGAILSLGFVVILASLLALCGAAGCCGKIQWFGRRPQEVPLSFSNPMTEPGSTMMVPISQIDVRALELDPIVFEPLPTVHDLTPLNNKFHHDRGQLNHRNSLVPIVPFNANDASIFAHDWFEEPLNNFPRSNIEYVKEIGKGWFGQVIEAEARDIVPFTRKLRVIVKLLREDATGVEQMRFLDESRMYRDGNHGNILKLLGHSIEKLPFLLIMEHCPQGDLKSFLISNIIRAEMLNSQGTIIKMALDVAKGMEWLHNAGFVHPDLACRNCQVGSENRVVIGDCGLGTQNFKDDYHWSSNIAIPLRWTAPETLHCTSSIIQILKVTESSNIWTLGVTIWEICEFGKLPYFELADDEIISRVIVDKNYFLGRPTLPCMSAKEELYTIMSSCWEPEIENRPRLYTIVRQLEDIHKAFTCNATPSPKDDFEIKWEQLGKIGMDDDKRRKKNVSFLDLENQIRATSDTNSSLGDNEAIRNLSICEENVQSSNASHNHIVTDQEKDIDVDLDEEHWTMKIERGDITQKVLEKSQSVQDLMVLTHFEKGDMGELDSLVYIGKSTQQSSPPDATLNPKDVSNNNSSSLRKSCSEPAIDSISLANSSHTLTPSSICESSVSQSSTLVPQSPFFYSAVETTPNSTGVDIEVIPATPNPQVDINVIDATPSPSTTPSDKADSRGTNGNSSENSSKPIVNRRLNFKFESSPDEKGRQRQTSTPLRSGSTPSPRISDFGDRENDEDYPVFDSSGHFMEGTFSLSPISQHYITSSSFDSSKMDKSSKCESSVLFGPSDDHELGSYQGVKSQLQEMYPIQMDVDNEGDDPITGKTFIQSEPKVLPRRILFPNDGDKDNINGNEINFTSEHSSAFSNNKTNGVVDSNLHNQITSTSEQPSVDNDDFWKQQLKSLQVAADSTRQLFQTGLNDPEDRKDTNRSADDKRFVEDIEADVEELGSLVLHDLEEPDAVQTVIKETREAIKPDDGVSAKLAFQASNDAPKFASGDGSEQGVSSSTTGISKLDNNDSNSLWDINNSIEIQKGKSTGAQAVFDKPPSDSVVDLESDLDETEELTSQEFIPSKWNQSLVPSRSAIKSPEQQQQPVRVGMKKSVSFERKKTQLVYEYPPPPVASDSEDEEKTVTRIASASIPFSSSSSLDWELTQEELENSEWNHEDWDDEVMPKPGDPMDVYRISGFNEDNFQVRGSSEPFEFSPSTLGELRHTRNRLTLDLSRGEANFLDDDPNKSSNPTKLDSGVGSSTNVSPFNNCDILTKRSKSSD